MEIKQETLESLISLLGRQAKINDDLSAKIESFVGISEAEKKEYMARGVEYALSYHLSSRVADSHVTDEFSIFLEKIAKCLRNRSTDLSAFNKKYGS